MKGFSYFAIGTMGLITAAGAKNLVSDFLKNMSASADVLALAKVEVEMASIPEGKNVIIKVGLVASLRRRLCRSGVHYRHILSTSTDTPLLSQHTVERKASLHPSSNC
jgi:CTP:molybdopterin cytidylyltransferase MocA